MLKLKNKIVSNNLTAVLKAKKVTSKELLNKLSELGYPMQKQRYFDVKKNRREIYFKEAILMAKILGVKYTDLVKGNINL
jgi:murein L,D-transpeptidase YafK